MRSLKELIDLAHTHGRKGFQLSKRDGISFDEWMNYVDALICKRVGLGYMDLPDWLYRDAYEDEETCGDAATQAIEAARD